jgi:hypothetical protein
MYDNFESTICLLIIEQSNAHLLLDTAAPWTPSCMLVVSRCEKPTLEMTGHYIATHKQHSTIKK